MNDKIWHGINIYELIFENSPEAIVLLDSKAIFIEANNRLKDWIGYDPKDFYGKNILSVPFLSAKMKVIIAENFAKRILGQQIKPYEIEFKSKSGEIKVGRIVGTPIKSQDDKIIGDLIMISEVTELKEAERELKEKVEELEKLNSLMVDRELKMMELKERIKSEGGKV